MRGLIFASLALLPPFSGLWGSAELTQSGRAWCQASGACYSIHLGRMNFYQAQNACAQHGGALSTANGRTEVGVILALLKGLVSETAGSLFWLGLVKKAQQCTLEDLPLRGFSWVSPGIEEPRDNGTATPPKWLREPTKSCTMQRCAGLQVSSGQADLNRWGLKDHSCTKGSPGYICKYNYAGTCPALHSASGARGMFYYRLPFQLQRPAVEFSPPGTNLTIRCPGREARFTCRLSPNGSHWEGTERDLCSCPSGYWSPSSGDCAEFTDCFSAQGAFRCLCAWRSRLAADEGSCAAPARDAATTAKPTVSTPRATGTFPSNSTSGPGQNISLLEPFQTPIDNGTNNRLPTSNTFNYIFILITVAVVALLIMVMASLQVFQRCFKNCSSKGSQPTKDGAVIVEGDPEASATPTDSERSLGPSKAESIASQ
ncbi:C-type lectin domain family 14 member A [Pantherophis guttatus]|uniref:C-type lectin domain family 14 member A n=1 Tax=Pantherophis guttatus TaxID=94885 RepID=A0A6P9BVE1_PANGU|nr:C-type lectin domain family 14 member A [Pantherophis guttatus]